jgi:hypothetical protein
MIANEIQSAENEVVNRLRAFFEAMGRWESECKASYRKVKKDEAEYERAKFEWIESLKKLFQAYCTSWEKPRRTRYGIQFSMIPTYGLDLEEILSVEINEDQAKVVTQQNVGPKDQFVYRLTYDGSQWRIDDSRKRIENDETEVDWDL